MDEEQKPFDIVSIVILVMIGLFNDAAEVAADLLAATVVGLPGEAIMEPIDFLIDGIVTVWFFLKVGFGGPSVLQLVDDVLEVFGVPGRTICIVAGIWIANHPKSKLGQFAKLASTVEGGEAALGEAAEGAEAAEEIGAAAKGTEEAAEAEGKTLKGKPSEAQLEESAEPEGPEKAEKTEREKEIEEELTPETEKNPVEVEAAKLNQGPTDVAKVQDIKDWKNGATKDVENGGDIEDEAA